MKSLLFGIIGMSLIILGSAAQGAEPKENAKGEASIVTEPRSQTLKGFIYFHASTRTNLQNLGAKLHVMIPQVAKAAADAHANGTGGLVLIYHGAVEDISKEFDLDIGFPIAEKVTAAGEYKVSELGDYACMSVLYSGPLSHIHSAYEKLLPAAMGGGAKLTGESREMYFLFEGPDSVNNVVHISVGMK